MKKTVVLLDVDKTLILDDGVKEFYNEDLIQALLEANQTEIYLFTNMGLEDIPNLIVNPNYLSRDKLLSYLTGKGFTVKGVITPADVGYEQGLGAAFHDFVEPQYAKLPNLSLNALWHDAEFELALEKLTEYIKVCTDKISEKFGPIKGVMFEYALPFLKDEYDYCLLFDDIEKEIKAVIVANEKVEKDQRMTVLTTQVKGNLNKQDYQKIIQNKLALIRVNDIHKNFLKVKKEFADSEKFTTLLNNFSSDIRENVKKQKQKGKSNVEILHSPAIELLQKTTKLLTDLRDPDLDKKFSAIIDYEKSLPNIPLWLNLAKIVGVLIVAALGFAVVTAILAAVFSATGGIPFFPLIPPAIGFIAAATTTPLLPITFGSLSLVATGPGMVVGGIFALTTGAFLFQPNILLNDANEIVEEAKAVYKNR